MFIGDQKSRDTILGHFPLAAPMESPAIRLKPPLGHSEILIGFGYSLETRNRPATGAADRRSQAQIR